MSEKQPKRHPLDEIFIRVINESMVRDFAEADACRAEIKDKGTYWAGGEIQRLRKRIAVLERNLRQKAKAS